MLTTGTFENGNLTFKLPGRCNRYGWGGFLLQLFCRPRLAFLYQVILYITLFKYLNICILKNLLYLYQNQPSNTNAL